MFLCELHAVLWLNIRILMSLAAKLTTQYSWAFILLSVSLWNYLADSLFDDVRLADFKEGSMLSYWQKLLVLILSSAVVSFLVFCLWVGIMGLESSDWLGVNRLSPAIHCRPFYIVIVIVGFFYRWEFKNILLHHRLIFFIRFVLSICIQINQTIKKYFK